MDHSEQILPLQGKLSKLTELEGDFSDGPSALNIRRLREEFESPDGNRGPSSDRSSDGCPKRPQMSAGAILLSPSIAKPENADASTAAS